MAKELYEIKLKERYYPASSVDEALEVQCNGDLETCLSEDNYDVSVAVEEEHTMKLFVLAKTMQDTERYVYNEVEAAICALAKELGYVKNYAEVADCVLTWVDRFDDMSLEELEEWLTV